MRVFVASVEVLGDLQPLKAIETSSSSSSGLCLVPDLIVNSHIYQSHRSSVRVSVTNTELNNQRFY